MRKLFSTASLFFALAITTVANAQISHGGEPLFNNNSAKVTWNTYYLPTIDNEKYLEEDLSYFSCIERPQETYKILFY